VTDAVRLAAAEVRIGGRTVLGPLDLAIGRGERWALLGPNGGGKTTALALMGARRQPSSGAVTVLGERLGRTDVRALRGRIGHVSHRVAEELPGHLSVLDAVLTGRDGTLVRIVQGPYEPDAAGYHSKGWELELDRLESHLAGESTGTVRE